MKAVARTLLSNVTVEVRPETYNRSAVHVAGTTQSGFRMRIVELIHQYDTPNDARGYTDHIATGVALTITRKLAREALGELQ